MGEQEASAKKMAAGAKAIADSAQAELDLALPALDSALASLKSLTRNDIVEVKSLRNPPQGVKMVMEATCIMFNLAPKMVADPNKVALISHFPPTWSHTYIDSTVCLIDLGNDDHSRARVL